MHVTIIGCGQLARLMGLAGKNIGIKFTFVAVDQEATRCVEGLGNIVHWNKAISAQALMQAIGKTDVVTVEREAVDIGLLIELSMIANVFPRPESIAICQNRAKEKIALTQAGLPCTPWVNATEAQGITNAAKYFDLPLVVKAVSNGYDGKNQWWLNDEKSLQEFTRKMQEQEYVVEPKINFEREISIIGVRSSEGELAFYSPSENYHVNGILRSSIAPVESIPASWINNAKTDLGNLMYLWDYVGTIAMEMFVTDKGLLVNELAPRVHNSGHWTQLGATTSQFENHLRAILGLPLGPVANSGHSAMLNILGVKSRPIVQPEFLAHTHIYDKTFRLGRKLGHINLKDLQRDKLIDKLKRAEAHLYRGQA